MSLLDPTYQELERQVAELEDASPRTSPLLWELGGEITAASAIKVVQNLLWLLFLHLLL